MFIWFPNRHEMLDFIATTLPYSPPGRSDPDWGPVAAITTAIVEEMISGTIDDAVGVERLNETLQTCSQIKWTGTFNELLTREHSYAIKVRMAFRDEDGDDTSGDPIQPNEKKAFCEFLETWGI